jgi:uncharacterized protein (TIGR03083 family)
VSAFASSFQDDQAIFDTLKHTWTSIRQLASLLSEDQWDTSSALPGWDVHAVFSHVIGFELEWFLGREATSPTPDPWPTHVTNELAADNERWIQDLAQVHPTVLLQLFDEMVDARTKQLNAARFYPQGFGTLVNSFRGDVPIREAVQLRIFDIALHEQDIRWGLGLNAKVDGPGMTHVRTTMLNSLGYAAGKLAKLPDGVAVAVTLFGSFQQTLAVAVQNGKGSIVPVASVRPVAAITMHDEIFLKVTTGRLDTTAALSASDIKLRGDESVGRQFASALHIHQL